MKSIIIFAMVISFHTNSVVCSPLLDFVSHKWSEITESLADAVRNIRNAIKNFFYEKVADKTSNIMEKVIQQKLKKDFNDYVAKTGADIEKISPGYSNLGFKPINVLTTTQLAMLHGRKVDSHAIHTDDGYILTAHRIATSNENVARLANHTVVLFHGLLGSSVDWILLGKTKSLPYILSDLGCDVWMLNARGNYYSKNHTTMRLDSSEFWSFTWQEMGEYDLPATIDYIRKLDNKTKAINFIGHSMGASAFLVMLSTRPQYNKYIQLAILLAPLAFMDNIEGPLKMLTANTSTHTEQLLKNLSDKEFLPSREIPSWMANKFCKGSEIFCRNPLIFFSGSVPQNAKWDSANMSEILSYVPAGGSTNTILHYIQLADSRKFHRYGNISAEFNLTAVTVPIALFSSNEDSLATVPDILKLYSSIANPIENYVIRGNNFSHTDFVWGSEAGVLVFNHVIEILENGLNLLANKVNEIDRR